MNRTILKRSLMVLAVVGMMGVSYTAGIADATNAETLTKLNSTVDLLTKARALLNSTQTRKGYSDIEAAKKSIDNAVTQMQKAVIANGG